MKRLKTLSDNKKTAILGIALLSLSILCTLLIAGKANMKTGILLNIVFIGAALVVVSLNNLLFGLGLVTLISFVFADISRFFGGGVPLGTLIDLLVIMIFAGIVLRKLLKHESVWNNYRHPIVYGYVIIILYTCMQVINPNGLGPATTVILLRRFLVLQMYLYCCVELFSTTAVFFKFLRMWLVFAFFAAVYGCYQEWMGYPQYELDFINADPMLVALYASDVGGDYRKFSTLTDPTSFGIAMAISGMICIVLLIVRRNKGYQTLLLLVGVAFFLLSMGYSGTRTATAALSGCVAVYILLTINQTKTLVFAAVALMGFLFIMYGPIYGNPTINRVRSTFELSEDASLNVRDVNRHSIQPYLHAHPIGGGLGTTGGSGGEQVALFSHPLAGFPSDSGFLKMGLEYGWVGLTILCIVFFIILQQGVQAYFRTTNESNKTAYLVAIIGLFGFMLAHYAQVAIGPIPGALLFYGLVAAIIRLRNNELSQTQNNIS